MDTAAAGSKVESTQPPSDNDSQPKFRFWAEGSPEIPALMREILTNYSKIPDDQVLSHVVSMRDRAWAVYKYPCIGRYRFITFTLPNHRLYHSYILPRLKAQPLPSSSEKIASPLYFEIGICLGQEVRALFYQGVPVARVYGTDLESDFPSLGYEFFRDEDRFPASHQIAPVDVFDEANFAPDGKLAPFLGKVDILHLTSVFHLWDYEQQVEAAKRVLRLMRRGGVILGAQTANVKPTEYPNSRGGKVYRHNIESWEDMWTRDVTSDGVVTDTQTEVQGAEVKMQTKLIEIGPKHAIGGLNPETNNKVNGWRDDPGFRWMQFDVWVGPQEDAPV